MRTGARAIVKPCRSFGDGGGGISGGGSVLLLYIKGFDSWFKILYGKRQRENCSFRSLEASLDGPPLLLLLLTVLQNGGREARGGGSSVIR